MKAREGGKGEAGRERQRVKRPPFSPVVFSRFLVSPQPVSPRGSSEDDFSFLSHAREIYLGPESWE
jgi:hypothetical protein